MINAWITSFLKILLNKKICSNCMRCYSSQTIRCDLFTELSLKNKDLTRLLFVSESKIPVYIRPTNYGWALNIQYARAYKPALHIKVSCSCGHSYTVKIPEKNGKV